MLPFNTSLKLTREGLCESNISNLLKLFYNKNMEIQIGLLLSHHNPF